MSGKNNIFWKKQHIHVVFPCSAILYKITTTPTCRGIALYLCLCICPLGLLNRSFSWILAVSSLDPGGIPQGRFRVAGLPMVSYKDAWLHPCLSAKQSIALRLCWSLLVGSISQVLGDGGSGNWWGKVRSWYGSFFIVSGIGSPLKGHWGLWGKGGIPNPPTFRNL